MPNITTTQINNAGVLLGDLQYADDVLTFAGAGTVAAGTILARDSVSLKLVPFVKGGSTNGNGIPKTVIGYPVTATGAGDVPVRAPTRGAFRRGALIIAADGNGSNVDAAVLDQLRDYGLTVQSVAELNIADN